MESMPPEALGNADPKLSSNVTDTNCGTCFGSRSPGGRRDHETLCLGGDAASRVKTKIAMKCCALIHRDYIAFGPSPLACPTNVRCVRCFRCAFFGQRFLRRKKHQKSSPRGDRTAIDNDRLRQNRRKPCSRSSRNQDFLRTDTVR